MQTSAEKILTTHVGSLPRPRQLAEAMVQRDKGKLGAAESQALPQQVRDAIKAIVKQQVAAGIDIVNDGEASKIGYSTYVRERLTGFEGKGEGLTIWDLHDVPEFAERSLKGLDPATPACTGDIRYQGQEALDADIATLKAAASGSGATELFMTAASPGVTAIYLENQHYGSDQEYWAAIGEAMRVEYEGIVAAGLVLQIDAPDLAMGRHVNKKLLELSDFRRELEQRIEILNHACRNIPADKIRLHLCWGNYHGPHHHDTDLADIVDIILKAKVGALSFEAANPRHQHEWRVWEERKVPESLILIPGVIDTCTSYVEHPQLISDRIERFAGIVGRDRVIASTDCGFANFASYEIVDPKIAWMKLGVLAEGAALASRKLWRRSAA
jgi:5-methyltetrahydropteroyltriglutamate--homocysteine methyltransferase